jgi:hypothetical protein
MEKQKKIKRLNKGNASTAIMCIREGIDFSLNMGDGVHIQFVGGILTKLIDGTLYYPCGLNDKTFWKELNDSESGRDENERAKAEFR